MKKRERENASSHPRLLSLPDVLPRRGETAKNARFFFLSSIHLVESRRSKGCMQAANNQRLNEAIRGPYCARFHTYDRHASENPASQGKRRSAFYRPLTSFTITFIVYLLARLFAWMKISAKVTRVPILMYQSLIFWIVLLILPIFLFLLLFDTMGMSFQLDPLLIRRIVRLYRFDGK